MTADPTETGREPWLRRLPESRPPATTWLAPVVGAAARSSQPTLDLGSTGGEETAAQPHDRDVRVVTVRARWTVRPRRDLPDPETWCTSLALAIVEAWQARRPIAQLNRWLADDVLAEVSLRRRRSVSQAQSAVPAVLRSVRIQHPHPEVAEVAAHLTVGGHSTAVAFRLEAWNDRWLCTALELGPRTTAASGAQANWAQATGDQATGDQGENSSSRPAQV